MKELVNSVEGKLSALKHYLETLHTQFLKLSEVITDIVMKVYRSF